MILIIYMNNLIHEELFREIQYWKAPKEVIKFLTYTGQKGEIQFQYIDWRNRGC